MESLQPFPPDPSGPSPFLFDYVCEKDLNWEKQHVFAEGWQEAWNRSYTGLSIFEVARDVDQCLSPDERKSLRENAKAVFSQYSTSRGSKPIYIRTASCPNMDHAETVTSLFGEDASQMDDSQQTLGVFDFVVRMNNYSLTETNSQPTSLPMPGFLASRIFGVFDADHSGDLDYYELYIGALGLSFSDLPTLIRCVFSLYDLDASETLTKEELLVLFHQLDEYCRPFMEESNIMTVEQRVDEILEVSSHHMYHVLTSSCIEHDYNDYKPMQEISAELFVRSCLVLRQMRKFFDCFYKAFSPILENVVPGLNHIKPLIHSKLKNRIFDYESSEHLNPRLLNSFVFETQLKGEVCRYWKKKRKGRMNDPSTANGTYRNIWLRLTKFHLFGFRDYQHWKEDPLNPLFIYDNQKLMVDLKAEIIGADKTYLKPQLIKDKKLPWKNNQGYPLEFMPQSTTRVRKPGKLKRVFRRSFGDLKSERTKTERRSTMPQVKNPERDPEDQLRIIFYQKGTRDLWLWKLIELGCASPSTRFHTKYAIQVPIGSGSFGSVYTCIQRNAAHHAPKNVYAVKVLDARSFGYSNGPKGDTVIRNYMESLANELSIMRLLWNMNDRCIRITDLVGDLSQVNEKCFVVMELADTTLGELCKAFINAQQKARHVPEMDSLDNRISVMDELKGVREKNKDAPDRWTQAKELIYCAKCFPHKNEPPDVKNKCRYKNELPKYSSDILATPTESFTKILCLKLLKCLRDLHSPMVNVVHRDVKPDNILILFTQDHRFSELSDEISKIQMRLIQTAQIYRKYCSKTLENAKRCHELIVLSNKGRALSRDEKALERALVDWFIDVQIILDSCIECMERALDRHMFPTQAMSPLKEAVIYQGSDQSSSRFCSQQLFADVDESNPNTNRGRKSRIKRTKSGMRNSETSSDTGDTEDTVTLTPLDASPEEALKLIQNENATKARVILLNWLTISFESLIDRTLIAKMADFGMATILAPAQLSVCANRDLLGVYEIAYKQREDSPPTPRIPPTRGKSFKEVNSRLIQEKSAKAGPTYALPVLDNDAFEPAGTPVYAAPEIFQGQGYSVGVDVWSLGIMAYEMLTYGYVESMKADRKDTRSATMPPIFPCSVWRRSGSCSREFVSSLLTVDPELRPVATECLKLDFLRHSRLLRLDDASPLV